MAGGGQPLGGVGQQGGMGPQQGAIGFGGQQSMGGGFGSLGSALGTSFNSPQAMSSNAPIGPAPGMQPAPDFATIRNTYGMPQEGVFDSNMIGPGSGQSFGSSLNQLFGSGAQPATQSLSAQTQPSFAQSPYGLPPPSVYTSSFPNMPPPQSGGQSLGGVSPYGGAPRFGQQFPMQGGFVAQRLGTSEELARAAANARQFTPEESAAMAAKRTEGFAGAPQLSTLGLAQRENPLAGFGGRQGMQSRFGDIGASVGQQGMQGGFGQQPMQPRFNQFQQPMQQSGFSGLQGLFNSMMGQMRGNMNRGPMPQYQNPSLGYRPNMQQAQQNLSRVRPSVYKTDLDAARARIAELEAAEQARNTAYDGGYSGGG